MKLLLTTISVALLLASFPAAADEAHNHAEADERAYGEPGVADLKSRVFEVEVVENDKGMFFRPEKLYVRAGQQVKFVIKNAGEFEHEFVLGTVEENLAHKLEMEKNPDMEHDDANMLHLGSKKSGEVLWKFTKKGTFDFSCLLPGHRDNGMFGTIYVQ